MSHLKIHKLVLGSQNPYKIEEFQEILTSVQLVSIDEMGDYPEAPEKEKTFRANARQKALFYSQKIDDFVLADDSGLEVRALDGAPGVYSKRFASEEGDHEANNALLLEKLNGVPMAKRQAQFRCALALARKGEILHFVEGICRGYIAEKIRGEGGFGYDPLFIYPPWQKTFGEVEGEYKNQVSHRSLALRALREVLEGEFIGP